jgi:hypothetical protein
MMPIGADNQRALTTTGRVQARSHAGDAGIPWACHTGGPWQPPADDPRETCTRTSRVLTVETTTSPTELGKASFLRDPASRRTHPHSPAPPGGFNAALIIGIAGDAYELDWQSYTGEDNFGRPPFLLTPAAGAQITAAGWTRASDWSYTDDTWGCVVTPAAARKAAAR